MQVNEPLRDHIARKLEDAMGRLNDDLDRVEFWAAALDAMMQPVPTYEPGHDEFLLPCRNDRADGISGGLRASSPRF